jgi:hypothetical protein
MSNGRKVSTDALETLGTIIDDTQKRDAIHIAVLPIVAAERLLPAQHIGLVEGGAGDSEKPLGIVDPFLTAPVRKGQRFWMLLYPRMVTSLRHVWSHPAFEDADGVIGGASALPVAAAEHPVIAALANEAGLSYEEMLRSANDYADSGEYRCDGGRWEGVYAGDDFWDAFEKVTGRVVAEDNRGGIFTCSC